LKAVLHRGEVQHVIRRNGKWQRVQLDGIAVPVSCVGQVVADACVVVFAGIVPVAERVATVLPGRYVLKPMIGIRGVSSASLQGCD
jgi:hypothetical protein